MTKDYKPNTGKPDLDREIDLIDQKAAERNKRIDEKLETFKKRWLEKIEERKEKALKLRDIDQKLYDVEAQFGVKKIRFDSLDLEVKDAKKEFESDKNKVTASLEKKDVNAEAKDFFLKQFGKSEESLKKASEKLAEEQRAYKEASLKLEIMKAEKERLEMLLKKDGEIEQTISAAKADYDAAEKEEEADRKKILNDRRDKIAAAMKDHNYVLPPAPPAPFVDLGAKDVQTVSTAVSKALGKIERKTQGIAAAKEDLNSTGSKVAKGIIGIVAVAIAAAIMFAVWSGAVGAIPSIPGTSDILGVVAKVFASTLAGGIVGGVVYGAASTAYEASIFKGHTGRSSEHSAQESIQNQRETIVAKLAGIDPNSKKEITEVLAQSGYELPSPSTRNAVVRSIVDNSKQRFK